MTVARTRPEQLELVPAPKAAIPPDTVTAVDLFCGAGGLSQGLRQAGISVLAGSDNDPDACATYTLNFPESQTLCGDIRTPELRDQVRAATKGADIIVGGPPCQAFSQVRNHTRIIDDPRNSLYREFVSAVADAMPPAFMMENVPGMAQMGVLEQVTADLQLGGAYRVEPQVCDAANFGVPQTRKRLLFLGVRADIAAEPPKLAGSSATSLLQLVRFGGQEPSYSLATKLEARAAEMMTRLADPDDLIAVTAAQAIGDLMILESGRRLDELTDKVLGRPKSAYQRLMRKDRRGPLANVSVPRIQDDTRIRLSGIPAGGNYRDLSEELQRRYITGAKWGPSNGSGRLGRAHYYAYRRLHPDFWAWTLNTKGDSAYHYSLPRCLSVREFARLQSFPDSFIFATDARRGPLPGRMSGGAAHSRYRQVGNAVPPLLAQAAVVALRDLVIAARKDDSRDASRG